MEKLANLFLASVFVLFSSFSWNWSKNLVEKKLSFSNSDPISSNAHSFSIFANTIYDSLHLEKSGLNFHVFENAITGYYVMKGQGLVKQKIISIVDFDMPSKEKRMWIINLQTMKLLFHSLVAHGKNSGDELAVQFSNKDQSFMSSLGFYVTGNTYCGKHGLSLVLKGMDKEYNSNAERRAIVLHGADYVCEDFIQSNGRLGRSHGCPAVPNSLHKEIIENIKNGSLLFIHKSVANYQSEFLDKKKAVEVFNQENFSSNTQNQIFSYK